MTSRQVSIRPDNIPSSGNISFKNGFPVLSFTIQSQAGLLDPRTIRINGDLNVYRDNASPTPTPVTDGALNNPTMDNRLGIYNVFDQLVIRHNKSKQICEHIRNYGRMMNSMLGVGSSKQSLMSNLGETCLIMPNKDTFFDSVIKGSATHPRTASFSAHISSGFIQSGNMINLMETSFGGIQIEIHLTPDSQALFGSKGVTTEISDAHYRLANLSLTCEIADIASDQMSKMSSDTSGEIEFMAITSLYTSINSTNAQLQYSLGLKGLQSVFMNFCPSAHLNTLKQNGMATTMISNQGKSQSVFTRIQMLRGGVKYPQEFDIVPNNVDDANTSVVDPQVVKMFMDSILPETTVVRSSMSNVNNNRHYTLDSDPTAVAPYTEVPNGGALYGLGCRYSQYNSGQDFSTEQWGISLETLLQTDNPISVFLYFKARSRLVWNANGVQLLQ